MKTYTYNHPHPAVTTDCVIFGFDGEKLKILLIERGVAPYKGCWALPGGFLKMEGENKDRDALDCAKRELQEETGLTNVYIEQLQAFTASNRDPREWVITIAHYALVRISEVKGGDDAARAEWKDLDNLPALAFDHQQIVDFAVKRLREKLRFEPVGFDLLDRKFTMTTLQNLYEAIMGVKYDRRNFSKKMLYLGLVERLDEKVTGAPNKAPYLFRFNKERYEELKIKGVKIDF